MIYVIFFTFCSGFQFFFFFFICLDVRFLSSSFYKIWESMGRGVSIGGGQSSLGYLFGSGEAPKPATTNAETAPNEVQAVNNAPASKPATASH
jgi:hypothetical protein